MLSDYMAMLPVASESMHFITYSVKIQEIMEQTYNRH